VRDAYLADRQLIRTGINLKAIIWEKFEIWIILIIKN
jgi:hypothetical protein